MMIRNFYLLLLLAFLFACDTASNIKPPGNNYFIKYYGGDGNQTAVDLIVNTDGTFFILGNSRQEQDSIQKIYLAKVNAQGDVIWQVTHGNSETAAKDFLLTPDGQNLVVVANTNLTSGNPNASITFFNATNGAAGVSTTIPTSNAYSNSITQLSDQGFMVSGYTVRVDTTSGWVYRVDQTLTPAAGWFTAIHGFEPGATNVIVQAFESASTGFFYFFGYTNATYQGAITNEFWAFKLGTNGGYLNNSDSLKGFASKTTDQYLTNVSSSLFGTLVAGIAIDASNNIAIKAVQIASVQMQFNHNDYVGQYQSGSLGKLPTSTSPAFATSCYSSGGGKPGFLILANTYLSSSGTAIPGDIALNKIDATPDANGNLSSIWKVPVQFGGDGEDTAAAVAELPDGHIMLLGTMQLGNPPEQFKIVMMKLNSSGVLGE